MIRFRMIPTLLVMAALCQVPIAAQDAPAIQQTEQGVLIDFQNAELGLVISALAEAGHFNVVYSDLPIRLVTLRMQQPVTQEDLQDLFESFARSNGLTVSDEGAFLRVSGTGEVTPSGGQEQEKGTELRLFVYRLKHARAAKLGSTLQAIFGGARAAPTRTGLRQVPLSQSLREQRLGPGAPAEPDQAAGQEAAQQAGSLPGQLAGEVQIVPDETTNALLVRAQSGDWDIVRQAIEALDLRPLQVLIEVVIAEVRLNKEKGLSVSGAFADSKNDPTVTGTLRGETAGDVVLNVLSGGTVDLDLTLSALSSRGEVKILSRPVILAQNNQEARILIGSERPFVQVSRSLPTDVAIRDQVIQYRDVGTKLTIVPTINDDGYVNLEVLQEVSSATAESQFDAPIISTREAATHLFVRDGQTAVIGGLIDQLDERSKSGIPVLMDIPLFGALFGSTKTTTIQSELFLFLTPHIVSTDDGMDQVREGIRQGTDLIEQVVPADSMLRLPIPIDSAKSEPTP